MGRYVYSKWLKTEALISNPQVAEYVPKTVLMNKQSLELILNEYNMVYIKPEKGTFGIGVMKVMMDDNGAGKIYSYQAGKRKYTFHTYEDLFASIQQATKGRAYLAQRGIHLLQFEGRPFDIRVMVQLNAKRKWETNGIIGRVAHPRKIVTNYHGGGTPMSVERLLHYLPLEERNQHLAAYLPFGKQVAEQLQKRYPGIREIGIDVGVDQDLHPWILEVNTCPDPFIFNNLADKRIYRKIIRITRAWGRFRK